MAWLPLTSTIVVGTQLTWEPIRLDRSELLRRARFHQNPGVDVAIIDVQDLLTEKLKAAPSDYLPWYGVTRENLPGQNKISVEVSDDVVVIGYGRPRGRRHCAR